MFDVYLARWRLVPDGAPIATPHSRLLPVRLAESAGAPAMLKIAVAAEEARGARVLAWWQGGGAVRVLAREGRALLMERADGAASLRAMVSDGRDDEASRVVAGVAARLHARRGRPPAAVVPLRRWFAALEPAAARRGGVLAHAAAAARELLRAPRDCMVLHGDLHHDNVLDGGAGRGWLAVDPKGLYGERAFDLANVFCNPDVGTATAPGRLARQASVLADAAGVERTRLVRWALAYAGLSAAWSLADGHDPAPALRVAELTAAELGGS